MKITASTLIRLGGELSLDFTNTKHWITVSPEDEWEFLKDYHELLRWSLQSGTLTADEASRLADHAIKRPRQAQSVMNRALRLREVIYRLFFPAGDGRAQRPYAHDLAVLNKEFHAAGTRLSIEESAGTYRLDWEHDTAALECVLWPVVRSAAELLTSERRSGVKRCGGCGWLFLDQSRRGNRRWCDMRVCGNRAKSRRHYERTRREQ